MTLIRPCKPNLSPGDIDEPPVVVVVEEEEEEEEEEDDDNDCCLAADAMLFINGEEVEDC